MTKTGKIKIAAIISALLLLFVALTYLAGKKYIQSEFFETVYIYSKFAILVASDLFIHFSRLIFNLVFSSWKVFAALLILFAIVVIRWLFGYHAD
jgi:hypothetical protein